MKKSTLVISCSLCDYKCSNPSVCINMKEPTLVKSHSAAPCVTTNAYHELFCSTSGHLKSHERSYTAVINHSSVPYVTANATNQEIRCGTYKYLSFSPRLAISEGFAIVGHSRTFFPPTSPTPKTLRDSIQRQSNGRDRVVPVEVVRAPLMPGLKSKL